MSLRTKQTLSVATGAAPTFTAATVSDTMGRDGSTLFAVYRSVHASSHTVTVVTPGNDPFGVAFADKAYTLGAGTGAGNIVPTDIWIPLIKEFQDPITGLITITVDSSATAVTMAVVER
jgi:hypothetical protein